MKSNTKVTFEMIKELAEKGVKAGSAPKQLGIVSNKMWYILKQNGVKYSDLKSTKKPQLKAWDTRKKQTAIDKYNNAKTAGIKASISRKFKKEFGIGLKGLASPTIEKVAKIKTPKIATTKESFAKKEIDLMIPPRVKELIETLIEKMVEERLKEYIGKLEQTVKKK